MGFRDKFKKIFKSDEDKKTVAEDTVDSNNNVDDYIKSDAELFSDVNESLKSDTDLDEDITKDSEMLHAFKASDFEELNELIKNSVKNIVLDSDLKFKKEIIIDVDDLEIDGNGHSISSKPHRAFYITGKNITFKNITFKNCGVTSFEARFRAKPDSIYVKYIPNRYEYCMMGGAILNLGSSTFISCSFIENFVGKDLKGTRALNMYEFYSEAGAIFNGGHCTLIDCLFKDNYVEGQYLGSKAVVSKGYCPMVGCSFESISDFSGVKILDKLPKTSSFEHLSYILDTQNDKIVLEKDIIFDEEDDSRFSDGIDIHSSITIDGNGHTIDARHKSKIFNITGGIVTLKNMTLKNAYSNGEGGAIFVNNTDLIIEDITFKNNEAKSGGAIYNLWSNVNIVNADFISNSSEKTFSQNIFNKGSMTLENINADAKSILNESHICLYKESFGELVENRQNMMLITQLDKNINDFEYLKDLIDNNEKIELNCDIVLDVLKGEKSSIFIYKDIIIDGNGHSIDAMGQCGIFNFSADNITLRNITLKNAYSNENAGAILNRCDTTLENVIFENNIAQQSPTVHNNAKLTALKCRFQNNFSANDIIFNEEYLTISNSIFAENTSKNVLNNQKILTMDSGEIVENKCEGNIFLNDGKSASITKTKFRDNVFAGHNISNKSELLLKDFNIDDRSIFNDGMITIKGICDDLEEKIENHGKIDLQKDSGKLHDFTELDMIIHGNGNVIKLAENFAIENYERDYFEGGIDLDIDNLVIDGNNHIIDANNLSRIFLISGKNITLKNITFKNGRSFESYEKSGNCDGGSIKVNSHASLVLENCKFISNESENNGGVISNSGKLEMKSISMQKNLAQYHGGAIINGGIMKITDSAFSLNSIEEKGGAIFNLGKIIIWNSSFNQNAGNDGGAIFNDKKSILEIHHTDMCDNVAKIKGGAIRNAGKVTVDVSKLEKNTAGDGGSIYNQGELLTRECILTKNISRISGGAIFNDYGRIKIEDCNIINNNCHGDSLEVFTTWNSWKTVGGGAIYNFGHHTSTKIEIYDTLISQNESNYCGGAIQNHKGELILQNSTISNNLSKKHGAALCNFSGHVSIKESTIKSNMTNNGSVINDDYADLTGFEKGEILIENTSIIDNLPSNQIVEYNINSK